VISGGLMKNSPTPQIMTGAKLEDLFYRFYRILVENYLNNRMKEQI